jgi:hypothetical protein
MVEPVSNGHASGPAHQLSPEISHMHPSPPVPQWTSVTDSHRLVVKELEDGDSKLTASLTTLFPEGQRDVPKSRLNVPDAGPALASGGSVSEKDEEAVVYSNTRMLQDPSGRLCKCLSAYSLHIQYLVW